MKRVALACSVTLLLTAATVFAQGKAAQAPATKTTPTTASAPAAPAKFVKTLKGTAEIRFIQVSSKKVGPDIVTVLKIKNLSPLAISLLKVDEYWYDKTSKVATGDTQSWRKPFLPGEIIEVTMKSPFKPFLTASQYQFSHAGGKVDVKRVTKFE
jgi:hypothetical protein